MNFFSSSESFYGLLSATNSAGTGIGSSGPYGVPYGVPLTSIISSF